MGEVQCVNLRELFGEDYRIQQEEPATVRNRDPWYFLIPCQHGHIYPHGGNMIGFASDKNGHIARRVAGLDFTEVTQHGDDGMNIIFPVDRFDEVAVIVKPKRRQKLSPEQRKACAERLKQFWFKSGHK